MSYCGMLLSRKIGGSLAGFYGIGVGPGDPGLLTIKAVEQIKKLSYLLVPTAKEGKQSVAFDIAAPYIQPKTEIIPRYFPMVLDMAVRHEAIDAIAKEIEELVRAGHDVGFLVLGDPMIYATYGYLVERLLHKIPVQTIPGVSSFSAIASGENRILVAHDQPLVIYPWSGDVEEMRQVLIQYDYIVLMKVYKHRDMIRQLIEELSLMPYVLVSSNHGKSNEQTGSFETFDWDKVSYFTTILINKKQPYDNDKLCQQLSDRQ